MSMRHTLRVAVLSCVVVLVAAMGVALSGRVRPDRRPVAPAATLAPATTPVTRMTLVETVSIDGLLSHGPAEPVESKAVGTVTWLPEVGAVLRRGDTLLRADEKPVVLLYGTLPMYRALALDVVGGDVEQFETNLKALGFDGFTVDQRFTAATEAAVRRWQRSLHLPETGRVEVAAVSYAPGPVRVASRLVRIGASATGQVVSYTPEAKVVTTQVPAAGAAWAMAGAEVTVTLPGGAKAAGVVAAVGTAATAPAPPGGQAGGSGDQTATVVATIAIADQAALARLDRAPVKVRYVVRERRDVLTVPVAALLAPLEGGYAVEVVDGARTRVTPVAVGMFADGRVEVSGAGVEAGVIVRVPT